jgi:nucleotide-binding universal stress UspA family protein
MIEINRILCPIDFSAFSERALAYAMKLSVWFGARLQVLHVMPLLPPSAVNALAAANRELAAHNLQSAVERVRLPNADVVTELRESSDTAAQILEVADAFDPDLIVTGSHGRAGIERVLLGSVVEALLHRCTRPILTVPSHFTRPFDAHGATFGRIVCAVDFSEPSLTAVEFALSLAEESSAELTLLHVIDMPLELQYPPQPTDVDFNAGAARADAEAAALQRLRALIPENASDYCRIETTVREGGVSRQLLRTATERQADLIVLGVHGRNAFDLAFFGSNSKDAVRQAQCPVLVVPRSRPRARMKTAS